MCSGQDLKVKRPNVPQYVSGKLSESDRYRVTAVMIVSVSTLAYGWWAR